MNDTRWPFCIAIAGPTASGKTAAALALADRWPIEIISVDSALVYRDMDIGTAKPSAAERAAAPHHLIDIIDPADTYSAARFVADAQALIADIHTRGRTPVLVGGNMLYLKALMEGLDEMPPADDVVRQRLEAEALAVGERARGDAQAAGDAVTGATTFLIEPALDTGPVFGVATETIRATVFATKNVGSTVNIEIVKRCDLHKFVVLPKRWIVERTIAWLNRCRRLAKDWECLNRSALAFLRWASIRLMIRKLCQNSK